jgi:hypothetical protein
LLRLDDQQPFLFIPDFSFPSIDGADGGDEVDAGGQTPLYQGIRNLQPFFLRAARNEDNNGVRHSLPKIRNPNIEFQNKSKISILK